MVLLSYIVIHRIISNFINICRSINISIPITASVLTTNQPMDDNASVSVWFWIFPNHCLFTNTYFTFGTHTTRSKFINQISLKTCFSKQSSHSFSFGCFFIFHLFFLFIISKTNNYFFFITKNAFEII